MARTTQATGKEARVKADAVSLPAAPIAVAALQVDAASDLEEIGFFAWDVRCGELTLSDRAVRILDDNLAPHGPFDLTAFRKLPVVGRAGHIRAIRRSLGDHPQPIHVAFVLVRRDGDRRQLRASVRAAWRGGTLAQLVGALIDQTDQHRGEAELRATMSTVPSAMIVIDDSGVIRAFSAAAERMFGRIAADMIGLPIETLMPEPYRSEHAGYLARYLRTNEARIIGQSRIMTAVRADGTEFPIELWVGDASTATERLFTGFIRDHSVRFETEAKLQMLQNDLLHMARQGAVGELSMALAHELNQPLGAIVNHLETADYLARSDDPVHRARLVQTIANASEQSMRAGAIVKRLRTFIAKGEADMRIEPVAAIVQEATSLLSSAIRQKGIVLRVSVGDRPMNVLADRVQIQQVLFNLLRNAIEALETEGLKQRTLAVTARQLSEGRVEIGVEDSGPGIAPALARTLFTPFSTDKPGGMGVGLSISRRIMEAHGGELGYAPATDGGARFFLILPAAQNKEDSHV